jgi:hypothetical protein
VREVGGHRARIFHRFGGPFGVWSELTAFGRFAPEG